MMGSFLKISRSKQLGCVCTAIVLQVASIMPRRVDVVNTVRSTINRVECTPSEPQAGAPPNRTTLSLGAPTLGATAIGFSPIFVRLAEVGPITSAFWRVTLAATARQLKSSNAL
jgi:hypothetical protein